MQQEEPVCALVSLPAIWDRPSGRDPYCASAHLGFTERSRWEEADGEVRNVESEIGATEVWLDGDAAWWIEHGEHAQQWVGFGSTTSTLFTPASPLRTCG